LHRHDDEPRDVSLLRAEWQRSALAQAEAHHRRFIQLARTASSP
jgi:hypothetical protein